MENLKALVSTIKTVVMVVNNLAESRRIFEDGLGLTCVGETETSTIEIGGLWGIESGNFRVARFARHGEDFGCLDLVENVEANKRIRDENRSFDYGIMTLNFRTNDIVKAIEKLTEFRAAAVSEILEYNAGKPMKELMLKTSSGERLTILQIGEGDKNLPVFNEAIATVGMVVPKMSDAKSFYENSLGLQTAIAFQAKGSPFDALLGVTQLDKLDFATLTADGNWTGKVELLELEVANETPINSNEMSDLLHTGYTFVTFLTKDIFAVAENCKNIGAEIIVEPKEFNRPFHIGKRAMVVRASGGEYLEIIEGD